MLKLWSQSPVAGSFQPSHRPPKANGALLFVLGVMLEQLTLRATARVLALASVTRSGLGRAITLAGALAGLRACHSLTTQPKASLKIVLMPRAGSGGPESVEPISGTAIVTAPGQQVVLYSPNGSWWVQPFRSRPFTSVESNATWDNVTHVGSGYAALLVAQG